MTRQSCFGCGTEWMDWLEYNCDNCKKNVDDDGDFECEIQKDIFTQAFGDGSEEIKLTSYNATQKMRCPKFKAK